MGSHPIWQGASGAITVQWPNRSQPAELRPGLLRAIAATPGVAPYFDLSFQHASPALLRRMRRFGGGEEFLDLIAQVRVAAPGAGIRCNVIVGFPGETEAEFTELVDFLTRARLDVIGVFGYSDEDGKAGGDQYKIKVLTRHYGELIASLNQEVYKFKQDQKLNRTTRRRKDTRSLDLWRTQYRSSFVFASLRLRDFAPLRHLFPFIH